MNLSEYDRKYVRVRDKYGETFSGLAHYAGSDFLECEYGGNEDGIFIEDFLLYNSQIESIEEIEVHGTTELWTENLVLRRYCPDDAEQLYERFGTDPDMYKYSGWNPFATREMARETVQSFIDSYDDEHSYSWVMDADGVVVGTIGAYDYNCDQIEVGFSICRRWQGRGLATEALKRVLEYLTENEGVSCVTAWCAEENAGSRRVLEKSGMRLVRTEKAGLAVGDKVYDKLIYAIDGLRSSELVHPFGPLFNENSRVLILGSFPSVKSREQNFFYGHPQNRFWKVVAAVFEKPVPQTIDEKKKLILENGLALWDSIASCEITGSSDASIRNARPNDIGRILDNCSIERIYCNGRKSYELYNRYIEPGTGREAVCLPSTSPANARWTLDKLIEAWSEIAD